MSEQYENGWFAIDDPNNPAPKDGTRILIETERSGACHIFWWRGSEEQGGWFDGNSEGYPIMERYARCWQPLPGPSEPQRPASLHDFKL